jgi:hypothetical protein
MKRSWERAATINSPHSKRKHVYKGFAGISVKMGGGNGLKSHMSRERNQAKKDAEGKGGGGKDGLKERTESKIGTACAICRAPFTSIKMKAQLVGHWETKHPKNAYAECFPDVPM